MGATAVALALAGMLASQDCSREYEAAVLFKAVAERRQFLLEAETASHAATLEQLKWATRELESRPPQASLSIVPLAVSSALAFVLGALVVGLAQ